MISLRLLYKVLKEEPLWLGANFLTALLAAAAIGIFEATIEKVVALAILMPLLHVWAALRAVKV
jgi:magnesium transporter